MALPTKPTTPVPTWATDATYTNGDDVGITTKVEPTTGEKAEGHFRGKRPPARKINWLKHWMCQWLGWSEAALDDVDSRVTTLENQNDSGGSYAPASVTSPTNITVDYLTVSGRYDITKYQAGELVTVYFRLDYTPTGSGLKSVEIPVPTAVDAAPGSDFSQEFHVIGHGTALVGTTNPYSAITIYPVISSKRMKVEWYDTLSSGIGVLRGSYRYQR